jgi:hypothetical protein
VSEGRRGDAAENFMVKVVGLPPEFAAYARSQPWRAYQEALAHMLAYDATVMGDYDLPTERAARVTIPTIVLDGRASFDWMATTAQALVDVLPAGQRRTLEGQAHDVDPNVLAPIMKEFFEG